MCCTSGQDTHVMVLMYACVVAVSNAQFDNRWCVLVGF
jgi:hypothetical protein